MLKGKFTPPETNPLVKDENGEQASGMFSCSSIVGLILYMSENTRPDVSLAVNICSWDMFSSKSSHKFSLYILSPDLEIL